MTTVRAIESGLSYVFSIFVILYATFSLAVITYAIKTQRILLCHPSQLCRTVRTLAEETHNSSVSISAMSSNSSLPAFLRLAHQSDDGIKLSSKYVDHTVPQHLISHSQLTLLIAFALTLAFWILRRLLGKFRVFHFGDPSNAKISSHFPALTPENTSLHTLEKGLLCHHKQQLVNNIEQHILEKKATSSQDGKYIAADKVINFDEGIAENIIDRHHQSKGSLKYPQNETIQEAGSTHAPKSSAHQKRASPGNLTPVVSFSFDHFLNKMVVFGLIMIFFFMCDYYKVS